jgi:hypothetical protein
MFEHTSTLIVAIAAALSIPLFARDIWWWLWGDDSKRPVQRVDRSVRIPFALKILAFALAVDALLAIPLLVRNIFNAGSAGPSQIVRNDPLPQPPPQRQVPPLVVTPPAPLPFENPSPKSDSPEILPPENKPPLDPPVATSPPNSVPAPGIATSRADPPNRKAPVQQKDFGTYLERRLTKGNSWWLWAEYRRRIAMGYSWRWDDDDFVESWKKCEPPNMPMPCHYPQSIRATMPQYVFDLPDALRLKEPY